MLHLLQSIGSMPSELALPLLVGFLCLASMLGGLMRAAFTLLMTYQLMRRAALPVLGLSFFAGKLIA